MKSYATKLENRTLLVTDRAVSLAGKDYDIWSVKAEHIVVVSFTYKNHKVEIMANVLGESENYSVVLSESAYDQMFRVFTSELLNVKVRSLPLLQQLLPSFIKTLLLGTFTGFLVTLANSDKEDGLKGAVVHFLNERVGVGTILLIGGILTVVYALLMLKVLLVPEKGARVHFNYGCNIINFS